jgi:hypothetical protein
VADQTGESTQELSPERQVTLKMEALCSSEGSVTVYKSTQCDIQEELNVPSSEKFRDVFYKAGSSIVHV